MKEQDFTYLAQILKDKSGLFLTQDKSYLLETRLTQIVKKYDFTDISAIVSSLKMNPRNLALISDIVEAMTTNESMFFRDIRPFEQFRNIILPKFAKNNIKKLRIWSAACSNGQEPYSISMCLRDEAVKIGNLSAEIIATDIDKKVIKKAAEAIYTQFEVQRGVPIKLLLKYFSKLDDTRWQLNNEIKNIVKFRQQNLLESFISLGKFDIIFLRNVLIYFDVKTKRNILEKMIRNLNNDGIIMLGGAETVVGITNKLQPLENVRGAFIVK